MHFSFFFIFFARAFFLKGSTVLPSPLLHSNARPYYQHSYAPASYYQSQLLAGRLRTFRSKKHYIWEEFLCVYLLGVFFQLLAFFCFYINNCVAVSKYEKKNPWKFLRMTKITHVLFARVFSSTFFSQ